MRQISNRTKAAIGTGWQARLHALAVVMVLAAAEAFAQEQAEAAKQSEVKREVIVSIADRKLALVENGEVVKVYPVAVGAVVSPSPTGDFVIVNRLTDPTYYHKGTVIPAGTSNPLGNRWIGLSQKGYGIHGTNRPRSIGKAASHGCIRMAKADLEEFFTLVRTGDMVSIRAERDEQIVQIFGGEATVVASRTNSAPTLVATAQSTPATSAAGGR